jgi:protein PhnA
MIRRATMEATRRNYRTGMMFSCLAAVHLTSGFAGIQHSAVQQQHHQHQHQQQHQQRHMRSFLRSSAVPLHAVPEPGSCPECSDENGYWDGGSLFVCMSCDHEWPVESDATTTTTTSENSEDEPNVIRDSNGNVLEGGETVLLTKELGKGLKKGLKVTRIRVGGTLR